MAIRWQRTRPQAQAFAMAPMVDMVFLLLVFFMCVTAASGGRARMRVDLPQTHTATATGADAMAQPQIILILSEGGQLTVNGLACEAADLLPLLLRLRADMGSAVVTAVRIRADANTGYGQIEPLLVACAQAGISKVSYAAHEASLLKAGASQLPAQQGGSQ